MSKVYREFRLWLISVLLLWIIKLLPKGYPEIALWVLRFPTKEFLKDLKPSDYE